MGTIVLRTPLEMTVMVVVMLPEPQLHAVIGIELSEGGGMKLEIKVAEGELDVTEGDKLEIDKGSANEEVRGKGKGNGMEVKM
jgi:hypothetical protein